MRIDDMTPEQLVAIAGELERVNARYRLNVSWCADAVLELAALVQLALAHPRVGLQEHPAADRLIAAARDYFADSPLCLGIIDEGDRHAFLKTWVPAGRPS